jgi:hypothetical protein
MQQAASQTAMAAPRQYQPESLPGAVCPFLFSGFSIIAQPPKRLRGEPQDAPPRPLADDQFLSRQIIAKVVFVLFTIFTRIR